MGIVEDNSAFEMKKESNGASVEDNMQIEVSGDKMSAYVTIYLSDEKIDIELLERRLRARGIIKGIDEDMFNILSKDIEYNAPYLIASGTPAQDGEPAVVEYLFRTERDMIPEMDKDGNVNYHKLNVVASVKKDQLLSKLKQATKGSEGYNIYGDILPPRVAKLVKLKYGKNIRINEEKTELYADIDGLVKIFEGRVVVNNIYDVPNNVGNSTGDIDFDGSVIVHGNIITGFSVKAKGDVEVIGVVEGATIISGGNIILHKGIQGMGKSHIEASGYIKAKYIENAKVLSGGDIHSEAVLHSSVTCKGSLVVEGKKGMISGGTIRAGEFIKTKILGSHMGTVTVVEVGIDPIMLQKFSEAKKDIPKMNGELVKLEQIIQLLNKKKEQDGNLDEKKQEMYLSAVRNKVILASKLAIAKKDYTDIKEQVSNKNNGFVDVSNELYAGVKVSIGNISSYIRDELKHLKLVKDGADIKMSQI